MYIHGCKQTPPTPPTTSDEESSGNTSDDETKKKKGNRAMGKKKYPKAIKYYTKAIKIDPANATYRLNRAIANSALELWKDAEIDAEQAVKLGRPASSKCHYQLARARLRRGRREEAREAVCAGLQACPGEAALIQLEREVKRAIEQNEAKERRAREAEAAKPAPTAGPGGARALLEQARAVYKAQRPEEVLRLCREAREAAIAAAAAAATGSPQLDAAKRDEICILSLAGKAGMQLRRWPDAAQSFQDVVAMEEAIYSMDVREEREALSSAYNNWGIALKNSGRLSEAVEALNKSYQTATNGDDQVATQQAAQVLQNAGQALRMQKKYAEARQFFSRALEIGLRLSGPEHASTALGHLCVARCLREEGSIMEAIGSYTKACEIFAGKDPEVCLAEMPEVPTKERLKQVQDQAKMELAQLITVVEQARRQVTEAAAESSAPTPTGATTTEPAASDTVSGTASVD